MPAASDHSDEPQVGASAGPPPEPPPAGRHPPAFRGEPSRSEPLAEGLVPEPLAGLLSGVDWDDVLARLADQPLEEGWVPLDEASQVAGLSRSTLRSWYRSGQIPSRMVAGVHGPQRLVPLEAVMDRALRSSRARRQLEHARSVQADVEELRTRVERLERHLGLR